MFFCLTCSSEVPLVCTSQDVSKSFSDHPWIYSGPGFLQKGELRPKGDQQLLLELPGLERLAQPGDGWQVLLFLWVLAILGGAPDSYVLFLMVPLDLLHVFAAPLGVSIPSPTIHHLLPQFHLSSSAALSSSN